MKKLFFLLTLTLVTHVIFAQTTELDNSRDVHMLWQSLNKGMDANATTPNGSTLLIEACSKGNIEAVKLLLQYNASPNATDKNGNTALMRASLQGNSTLLRMLLEAGANPNHKNTLGATALILAATFNREEIVQQLLQNGANKKTKDHLGHTALDYARDQEYTYLASLLKS